MSRCLLPLFAGVLLTACGGLPDPDGQWAVSVVSNDGADFTDCVDGETYAAINDSYTYQLYVDASQVIDLRIDGQTFASGQYVDGCNIEYESPAYVDGFDGADVQWQLVGTATVQGPAGGCPMSDDTLDWEGVETITVSRSDSDRLPMGCTRALTVTGTILP